MTKMTQRDLLSAIVDRGDDVLLSLAKGEPVKVQLEKRNRLAKLLRLAKEKLYPPDK